MARSMEAVPSARPLSRPELRSRSLSIFSRLSEESEKKLLSASSTLFDPVTPSNPDRLLASDAMSERICASSCDACRTASVATPKTSADMGPRARRDEDGHWLRRLRRQHGVRRYQ